MSLKTPTLARAALPAALAATLIATAATSLAAQPQQGRGIDPGALDGPPPPAGTAVVNQRGAEGVTIRAVRVPEPLRIDGVIDEAFYRSATPITEFVQSVPEVDAEPSERTEVWIGFDDEFVYVSAKIWDSMGPDGWIANEMRRDGEQMRLNDNFGVWLDTFYDRRNSVGFYGNAIGGLSDMQITNEGNPNFDWNPIRQSRTALFDGGWSIELAIPFTSLRYRPGRDQVWGIQLRRSVLRRNEWSHIRALPLAVGGSGSRGIFRVSMYGTLVGIEAPPQRRNLEVKPYAISGVSSNLSVEPTIENDGYADAGLDVKYSLTQNLTADLTVNTDFAQVEVDEQQVNLTRFSLFFPEKREFFLESRGIFDFGQGGMAGGVRGSSSGGSRGRGGGSRGDAPTLFHSRQIGVLGGQAIPIVGGARVTGKVGAFDVGAVNIQTDDAAEVGAERTNFTVLRLRRDLFARSTVGVLFENRSRSLLSSGSNRAWGFDGSFGLSDEVSLLGYYARTRTQGLDGLDASYRTQFTYAADEWGAGADYLVVGEDFNPEVGFARRKDFRQGTFSGRFSPRTESISAIRQISFQGNLTVTDNERAGFLESREARAEIGVEFESSDQLSVSYHDSYERLVEDESISGATVGTGRYGFGDVRASYTFGPQRPVTGNLSFRRGGYFGGDLTSVGFSRGRIEITPQLSVEPSLSFNWIEFPGGRYDQHLAVNRVTYALTPRAYVSGLIQYNSGSDTFSSNFRLRWEWAPGSELFVVYTEARQTDVLDRWSQLQNRGFVIKVNRLLRI